MRRALSAGSVALVLGLALLVADGRAPLAGAEERDAASSPGGFRHIAHESQVSASGAELPSCGDCHGLGRRGRLRKPPGHEACFGDCHGDAPRRPSPRRALVIDPARREICEACHAPADLRRAEAKGSSRLTVAYPPYQIDTDFALLVDHAAHADAAGGCLACHTRPGTQSRRSARRPPHSRCAGCHAASSQATWPPMSACESCHRAAVGPVRRPTRDPGKHPIASAFDHGRHARYGATSCRPCHDGAARSEGDWIATPKKSACAGCHDGERAFSMLEETCRRCHRVPVAKPPKPRPELSDTRFVHRAHRSRGVTAACTACHAADDSGAIRTTADHQSCGSDSCHADDFARTAPTICGACHIADDPWRSLHVDPRPPATTEFGSRFSHRRHLPLQTSCRSCHTLSTAGRELRLPRDHRSCTGETCHGDNDSAAPRLGDCRGCHALGLIEARETQRTGAPWSVRSHFSHRLHQRDTDGSPIACLRCHAGIEEAEYLPTIPAPAKAACEPCHDGDEAFKLTGHGCRRCHDP